MLRFSNLQSAGFSFLTISLLGFCFFSVPSLLAKKRVDIFEAQVPIESRQGDNYKSGAKAALVQVLAKSSGQTEAAIRANSALATDLAQAARWVEQYQYLSSQVNGETRQYLQVSFPEKYITDLIKIARLPFWPPNRPEPMVFAVMEQGGKVSLLNDKPGMEAEIARDASRFGLAPLFPNRYITRKINPVSLWQHDVAKIESATYGQSQDATFVIRCKALAFNTIDADWLLIDGEEQFRGAGIAGSLDESLDTAFAWLGKHYSSRAAMNLQYGQNEFLLSIANVVDFDDYTQVVQYLESLNVVSGVAVTQVEDSRMNVAVSLNTDFDKFLSLLEQGGRLPRELNQPDQYRHYFYWKK
ncbi:MAG: DUF2066 domain-containing protein [Cellvibrionales bacterium]|nr:DUF2066 domain-containing protein [Cellvibrionales bacterium]